MYQISLEEARALLDSHNLLPETAPAPSFRRERPFTDLSYDSHAAGKDTLFFVKGRNFREAYLADAVERGLEVYVAETVFEVSPARAIVVSDVKKAMAVIGMRFYGDPQEKLMLIAFTGTKGKTTAAYFTKNILDYSTGKKTALVSTVDTTLDGVNYTKSRLTTPESLDLLNMMAQAVNNGMKRMIVEVSSQAYKTDRVYGIQFHVGVFLNISPDHIGPVEHPSFEDYFSCKRLLLRNSAVVVINRDTDRFDLLLEDAAVPRAKKIYVYGKSKTQTHVYFESSGDDALCFAVKPGDLGGLEDICGEYRLRLSGGFNKENALAAAVAARLAGAAREDIVRGLARTTVPGRMEILKGKNGSDVYVDYAHNKASLEALLGVVKDARKGRVIVVMGATGSKGQSRRTDIGHVLGGMADAAVLTSDDPGFEDPAAIAEEIRAAMADPEKARIVVDRESAIRCALSLVEDPDDAVVIAGKGADRFQIVNGVQMPYDGDIAIAEKIIAEKD
ncbi:MAG: UDP-N-acetylmuramoyl-L-alanyl-D-glutamate--L-lysine ligase [Treponema sp.]|jgi:UDP-N-acetylmuramoyl-L-alanyl-D-glutamate-L-lysine ligase|nr:UDP-N-acetylmuramoyl-L-alanyl-D-glutamate--L-lysine ligase [Treponema sp.]